MSVEHRLPSDFRVPFEFRDPATGLRRLMLAAGLAMLAGCSQPVRVEPEYERPRATATDFERLPMILAGIRQSADRVLYEGLPGEFWDPQLREQELARKKTVRLHGYPFYEETLPLKGADAETLTGLLSARGSFRRYRAQKDCGGYQPEYCVEWRSGAGATRALICLECGEAKLFGPQAELHCDLGQEAGQKLKELLGAYRKNRPGE